MIVEKLMLDHYPEYFKNFQLLRWLAVLAVAFVVFLLGMWTWLMCFRSGIFLRKFTSGNVYRLTHSVIIVIINVGFTSLMMGAFAG